MKVPFLFVLSCLLFILLMGCGPTIPVNTTFDNVRSLWSWSGIWSGTAGQSMHLTQTGNHVSGVGTNPIGQQMKIEGEVSSNQLMGSITTAQTGGGYVGQYGGSFVNSSDTVQTATFTMSDDGKYAKSIIKGIFGITANTDWERTSLPRSLSGETNAPYTSIIPAKPAALDSAPAISISDGSRKTSEARTVLLVGNANYPQSPLRTPINDVRTMEPVLSGLGFDVILVENARRKEMIAAIETFSKKLQTRGGVGLIYYAGHGMQIKGKNFLIPIDADIQSEIGGSSEGVDVDLLIESMAVSQANVKVIILDACRNNPFERRFRGSGRGLAPMNAGDARGLMIAYSTAPGKTASDGEGRHSPYAEALANALKTPGLTIEQVFKHVRRTVENATGGEQIPWESSSLTGELILN